jgi:glycosyltransferase 2 family protein
VNRLVGAAIAGVRRFWEWSQRHRRVGAAVRVLREHWMETIAVLSLIALVIAVNPAELLRVYGRLHWQIALLMVPVILGAYVARGLGWWVTLRRIGVCISILRSVAIEVAGQVMIFVPTGDLARVALVEDTGATGRGPGQVAGTIAFQELLFMTVMGLGVLPRLFSRPTVALLVLLMTVANAGIFTVIIWERAYTWAVRTVERVRILRRFDRQLKEIRPAFLQLLVWRTLLPVVLCNAVAVGLSFLLFYLALHTIGVTSVSFVSATFVLALSQLVSGVSLLPGSIGAFEGLLTVLMIANGIPPASGAAAGLLYRAYNDILMALLGAGVGILLRRYGSGGRGEERDRHRWSSRDRTAQTEGEARTTHVS